MGNDIARDIHCDITMSNDIVMHTCCYEPLLLCITTPTYDIAVPPQNPLQLYT